MPPVWLPSVWERRNPFMLHLCNFNQERSHEAGYFPLARPEPI